MSLTITEFLAARYDEIEAMAKGAPVGQNWTVVQDDQLPGAVCIQDGNDTVRTTVATAAWSHMGIHIAQHDPAYVLADVAAKRALLKWHCRIWIEPNHPDFNDAHLTKESMSICRSCKPHYQFRRELSWPCRTLYALAEPFAAHPDYREAWRA